MKNSQPDGLTRALHTPLARSGTAALVAITAFAFVASEALAQAPAAPQPAGPAPAEASVCAKLAEADCASKEGCSWLPGFRVPGGADVPGYCRSSPRSINARRPKE